MSQEDQIVTPEKVIESYRLLSSDDPELRHQANYFLCGLVHKDQAWQITKNMVINAQDLNFQFLGTQFLYQKVSNQLQFLSNFSRQELKQFVFARLEDNTITLPATIDKLASIGALLAATSIVQGWPNVVENLITFMGKSEHNIQSGLFVLERIPEELRNSNRIAIGLKNVIIDQFLKSEKELSEIFFSILNMGNQTLTKKCLQAMQSWAKSRFSFLKYTQIIKKVLILSMEGEDKFESAIVMMLQTIKGATINKMSLNISKWEPVQEMQKYLPEEIESIKLIIQYIVQNKKNFISGSVENQYLDMYLDIIKQSLLNFGFLIAENIGFEMLDIIVHFTKSSDLRISQSTFEFWMDFSDKMVKCKIHQQIKNHFAQYIEELFKIVCNKTMVDSQLLLKDPDLKEDVTIDDINSMSFGEYRRESAILYQYIYNFFLNITQSPQYYFDRCFDLVGSQANGQLGRGTELALFCIKAPSQSMISDKDCEYICKFVGFVIEKGTQVYPRISVQNLLLVKDCTRQIKRDNNLCLKALNYSLFFLSDEKICHYAADAFKILMETLTTINDPGLISSLLNYYGSQAFPSEHIIDKIIEGIFLAITKMNSLELIQKYITQLIQIILNRFDNIHMNLASTDNKPYLTPVTEIKTVMDNFEVAGVQFQTRFQNLYEEILLNGLKMISIVIPHCLKQKMNYSKFNELGISYSIYKLSLKLCKTDISQQHLQIVDQTLSVLNKQSIVDKCILLQLLCWTMNHFVPQFSSILDSFLQKRLPQINEFYLSYMNPIIYTDADVIRSFFQIQETTVLYNSRIFIECGSPSHVYDLGMYILRHINEPKMQRKVINFLLICTQMQEFSGKSTNLVETIIGSIPIIANLSHNNVSKMFLMAAKRISNIRQIITIGLSSNPYEGLSRELINLLVNLIMFTIEDNPNLSVNAQQRNFMMIIKDLSDAAKNVEVPNRLTQLQFRLALWKKNKQID